MMYYQIIKVLLTIMEKYYIYKLVCNDVNIPYTYVGSTKNVIERKRKHKSDSNNEKHARWKVYRIINEHGGWDDFSMIIQETCDSKADAVKLEQKYYDEELNENRMNSIRPMITNEELKKCNAEWHKKYYNHNKDAIKEYQKQYSINNKDTRKEYHKQYKINNKDALNEQRKQYIIDNKDAFKEYKKEYRSEKIYCHACDCYFSKGDISKHKKTQRHQKNQVKYVGIKLINI